MSGESKGEGLGDQVLVRDFGRDAVEEDEEEGAEMQGHEEKEGKRHWWRRRERQEVEAGEFEREREVKHRYLPILSGLVCPFSVLLDVSRHLRCWAGSTADFASLADPWPD